MGIMFLMGLLFGAVAFFAMLFYEKKWKNKNKTTKWKVGSTLAIFGTLLGVGVSLSVGTEIAKKYLTSVPLTVLETTDLTPFPNSYGAYIVTGKNQRDEKVAWYLQKEELFEEPYNDIIDRNMIVFTNTTAPAKQLLKINVGSFWKWFVIIPNMYAHTHRFVIPAGGLQEGKVIKTYKYIPIPE